MPNQFATSNGVMFIEDSSNPGVPNTDMPRDGGDLVAVNAARLLAAVNDIDTLNVRVDRAGDGNLRVATLGDSWASLANSATVGTSVGATSRGIMTWLTALDPRIRHEVWIDATDPYGRNYSGANFGVSGSGVVSIASRMAAVIDTDPHVILMDGGFNDVTLAALTAAEIVSALTGALDQAEAAGIPVVYMGVWSPHTSYWTAGSDQRYLAQNVNEQMRRACFSRHRCIYFDTNSTYTDRTSAVGGAVPKTNHSDGADGAHQSVLGAYNSALGLLPILRAFIPPWSSELLISPDNIYHATKNPYGMMTNAVYTSSNPFLTGSASAAGTGITGSKATGLTIDRSTGTGTAVASKNADGSQRLVITPAASGVDTTFFLRFAAFSHGLAIGSWIKAYATLNLTGWSGWVQTQLECNDVEGLMTGFGMIPYDPLGNDAGLMPSDTMSLYIQTMPIQIVNAGTLRIRLSVKVRTGKAGAGTLDLISMAARPIPDPRPYWGY